MLRIDPALPRHTLWLRVMQSWRDSAWLQARNPHIARRACAPCRNDPFIAVARARGPHPWPHWMQESLHERLTHLRHVLVIDALRRRPFHGLTLADYVAIARELPGGASPPRVARAVHEAAAAVDSLDAWLYAELDGIDPWAHAVRDFAARPGRPEDLPWRWLEYAYQAAPRR
ncbi:MAG TPA: hypothetical protein VGC45_02035 [Gryllotalpicola sp.]